MKNSIEYKGHTIEIIQDEHAESPDTWGNDDCFLVYDHRQFCVERKGYDPEEIFETINRTKKLFFDGYYVFPVYAYIHSGVSLSLGKTSYPFTDPWDTSFSGFALVKQQKGWTYTRAKATKVAQSIVEEWNDYLSGNVYGYQITDPDGEETDSCWGFYGDPDENSSLMEQAKNAIDCEIKYAITKHLTQLKTWIKAKVGIIHRQPLKIAC